jgi:anti-sigma regulatory factor (Ser/Thr protein kinase)
MQKEILVVLKDAEEKEFLTPHLLPVSELIRIVEILDISRTMAYFEEAGKAPPLIIVSTRLYPEENPELVANLQARCPGSEILLVSSLSDPYPALQPLIRDNVRHLVVNPEKNDIFDEQPEQSLFSLAIRKIAEGLSLTIGDYLKPGTCVYEIRVSSSEQKEEIIARLEGVICGDSPEIELLRQKGALLADEMLENAIYGAPRRADCVSLYKKGEKRRVRRKENIAFRYGFDGETLAMEAEDGWGSLSPKVVLEHFAKNQDDFEVIEDESGRGLFILWRFLDHMHIHINPGRQTVVGGHVKLMTADNLIEKKGFHITTCRAA